jgi:hypothetical protein
VRVDDAHAVSGLRFVMTGTVAQAELPDGSDDAPSSDPDDHHDSADGSFWIPFPNKYADKRHAERFAFLSEGVRPGKFPRTRKGNAQYKRWRNNTRQRYRVAHSELYYNARKRERKHFTAQVRVSQVPWKQVLRIGQAWEYVMEDHHHNHDGHNRMEARLGQKYVISDQDHKFSLRAMCRKARQMCTICDTWTPLPKGSVNPIYTDLPMELLMFDLFQLPFADKHGNKFGLLIKDHLSKYHWGKAFPSKESTAIAEFLYQTFSVEGTPARFHADNGGEFINPHIDAAFERLRNKQYTHGLPRHPQCQGLIERANRTVKTKILQKGQEEGMFEVHTEWDWTDTFAEVLQAENDAPQKVPLDVSWCVQLRTNNANTTLPETGVQRFMRLFHPEGAHASFT